MSLSNFLRNCSKSVAGNHERLFVAKFGDIAGATFTNGVLTAISMDVDASFAVLEADLDTVQFTSTGTAGRGYFSEQNLIARFSQKTAELEIVVDELINASTCGLAAIRIDGNGRAWISGIAPLDKMVQNRPYLSITEEFDSGASIEAVDEGNAYTLTLGRMSATREYAMDASLAGSLLDNSATFVNWPA
jgi:hypothetical protein